MCAEGDEELSGKRTSFRRNSGKQLQSCTEEATDNRISGNLSG